MTGWLLALCLGANFTGEVDVVVSSEAFNAKMTMFVGPKGQVRMDTETKDPMSGKDVQLSIIKKNNQVTTLMHDKKQFMVVPQPPKSAPQKEEKFDPTRWEVSKLGDVKLRGFKTQHVRVVDKKEGMTSEMWIAAGYDWKMLSFLGEQNKQQAHAEEEMLRVFKKHGIKPGLPIKMVARQKGGKGSFTMEVMRIKKGRVGAAKFTPPKNYSKFEIPFGGFGGMQPGPDGKPKLDKAQLEKLKKQFEEMQKQRQNR